MKRVPLRDAANNQSFVLEGQDHEILPDDNTVYIDRQGKTYDPSQQQVALRDLSNEGVLQLPRTTWYAR